MARKSSDGKRGQKVRERIGLHAKETSAKLSAEAAREMSLLHGGMPAARLSEEVAANFRAWFRHNFVSPKAGRVGHISYSRAGELDDAYGQSGGGRGLWYAEAYERAIWDHAEPLSVQEAAFLFTNPLIAFQLLVGITDLRGLRCYRRGLTHEINRLQQKAMRRRYYAKDNARRRQLAAERRKVLRRRTCSPCPTPAAFREAFAHARDSDEARLRFGGIVHDLECHVDNCLRFDGNGEIVGRNGGIRAWIAENVPELSCRYKTIMRYKALAKRLRQAVGVSDPVSTEAILPSASGLAVPAPTREAGTVDKNYYAVNSHFPHVLKRARNIVMELIRTGNNTTDGLFERIDRLIEEGADGAKGPETG